MKNTSPRDLSRFRTHAIANAQNPPNSETKKLGNGVKGAIAAIALGAAGYVGLPLVEESIHQKNHEELIESLVGENNAKVGTVLSLQGGDSLFINSLSRPGKGPLNYIFVNGVDGTSRNGGYFVASTQDKTLACTPQRDGCTHTSNTINDFQNSARGVMVDGNDTEKIKILSQEFSEFMVSKQATDFFSQPDSAFTDREGITKLLRNHAGIWTTSADVDAFIGMMFRAWVPMPDHCTNFLAGSPCPDIIISDTLGGQINLKREEKSGDSTHKSLDQITKAMEERIITIEQVKLAAVQALFLMPKNTTTSELNDIPPHIRTAVGNMIQGVSSRFPPGVLPPANSWYPWKINKIGIDDADTRKLYVAYMTHYALVPDGEYSEYQETKKAHFADKLEAKWVLKKILSSTVYEPARDRYEPNNPGDNFQYWDTTANNIMDGLSSQTSWNEQERQNIANLFTIIPGHAQFIQSELVSYFSNNSNGVKAGSREILNKLDSLSDIADKKERTIMMKEIIDLLIANGHSEVVRKSITLIQLMNEEIYGDKETQVALGFKAQDKKYTYSDENKKYMYRHDSAIVARAGSLQQSSSIIEQLIQLGKSRKENIKK